MSGHPERSEGSAPLSHPERSACPRAKRREGSALVVLILALILLAFPAKTQAQAREPDRWLGADKAKHFIISSFAYSVSYSSLQLLRVDDPARTSGAALGAAIAGVGKEFFDRRQGGRFSPKDLVWDGAGAILAGLLMKHTRR